MFRNIILAVLVVLSVGCASARITTPVAESVIPEMPVPPMQQEIAMPAEPLALNEEASEVPAEPMPALHEYSDELYEELIPKMESAEAPTPKPVSVSEKKQSAAVTSTQEAAVAPSPVPTEKTEPVIRAAEKEKIFADTEQAAPAPVASSHQDNISSSRFSLIGALVFVIAGCALWIAHLHRKIRVERIAAAQHLREIDDLRGRILAQKREDAKHETLSPPNLHRGVLKEFQKPGERRSSPRTPRKKVSKTAAEKPPDAETGSPHKKGENEAVH